MGVTWGPFRDDGKDAAPYCPRPSMVLPRCPQRRAGELQGGVLRRRARHRPPRPTGSAAGLPAPVPASPLPAGRARSPPPERGGSRGDGGGGDCDQGSQWPGHGHPAGPGDGPVATVGQGKGRQGAGTARARCGVLCLARAPRRLSPGGRRRPPFLPSLGSGRPRRRSQQLPGFVGSGQRLSGKGCPERKPAIPPARLSVRHWGCEPGWPERGRAQGSCLSAERRRLGRSDRQLVLCCWGRIPRPPRISVPPIPFPPGDFAEHPSHPHLPSAWLQARVLPAGPRLAPSLLTCLSLPACSFRHAICFPGMFSALFC